MKPNEALSVMKLELQASEASRIAGNAELIRQRDTLVAALRRALEANDNPGKDYDWTTEAEQAIKQATKPT